MWGFIKKDFAMIKSNWLIVLILFILYAYLGLTGKMEISFILPFMSVVLMLSTFSYDEFNKWDAYAATLPNGRKNGVRAKYVATFLIVFLISLFTIAMALIIAYTKSTTIDYVNIFGLIGATFISTILVQSLMYPIIYKFGITKARIAIFVIVFVIALAGGMLLNLIDFSHFTKVTAFLSHYALIIFPLIVLLLLYGSYKISLRIATKKNF